MNKGKGIGSGLQGPPGEKGTDGTDGLDGTNGINGTDGKGIDPDLPHICDINWTHAGEIAPAELNNNGLVIAFDRPVINRDLHDMSIRVLMKIIDRKTGVVCWCSAKIRSIHGVHLESECDARKEKKPELNLDEKVNGVQIFFTIKGMEGVQDSPMFRVIINGDFIRGIHPNGDEVGLDADHLPPWLSTPGTKTGDGIEGGTFESWFRLKSINPDSINLATGPEILEVIGDSIDTRLAAENIVNHGWFSSWSEVLAVDEIGPARLEKLKSHFKLD